MQKLSVRVKELLEFGSRGEQPVAGKLKKDAYIKNEKIFLGKQQALVTKINHILDAW